jgi:hypothetical protein
MALSSHSARSRSEVFRIPLPSTTVPSNEYEAGELNDWDDEPFVGWWVGDDDNWHPPDEPFGSRHAKRSRRLRRLVMIALALAVVAATSVSVWGGPLTSPSAAGPSLAELTSQVRQAVASGSKGESSFGEVSRVTCHPPSSWSSGERFTCEVFGPSGDVLGHYEGTVQPATSSGGWRWAGAWVPSHQFSVE